MPHSQAYLLQLNRYDLATAASKRPKKSNLRTVAFWSWDTRRSVGGGEVGVPKNIMRAHCAVIRLDHFKFASYGPACEANMFN